MIFLQQPEVFGVPVYTTDDSTLVRDSPTRRVHDRYHVNNRNIPTSVSDPEEEQYGTPTFFSKDDTPGSVHQTQQSDERPILSILRDMLNNNKSHGLSVKDVANVTGVRSHGHYGSGAGEHLAAHYWSQDSSTDRSIYKHTQFSIITPLLPVTTARSPSSNWRAAHGEPEYDVNYESEYNSGDRFKQIWPYRTDDKYSLFYFHPSSGEAESDDDHGKVYPWPSLSDTDEVYDYQTREDDSSRDTFSTIG